jgi:hypothetical protein
VDALELWPCTARDNECQDETKVDSTVQGNEASSTRRPSLTLGLRGSEAIYALVSVLGCPSKWRSNTKAHRDW